MYAILSHGGRQYRVSAGDRLVVDRLDAAVGSVVALEPVLLTGGDGSTSLGTAVEGMRVAAIVVGHPRGEKLRIFKYKAKKRYRRVAGYRSDLTELRVDSILPKGAALPEVGAAAAPARSSAAKRAPAAARATTAAPVAETGTADAAAVSAPAKRRAPARAEATSEAGTTAETPARKPRATPAAKADTPAPAARKTAKRKETGDGA